MSNKPTVTRAEGVSKRTGQVERIRKDKIEEAINRRRLAARQKTVTQTGAPILLMEDWKRNPFDETLIRHAIDQVVEPQFCASLFDEGFGFLEEALRKDISKHESIKLIVMLLTLISNFEGFDDKFMETDLTSFYRHLLEQRVESKVAADIFWTWANLATSNVKLKFQFVQEMDFLNVIVDYISQENMPLVEALPNATWLLTVLLDAQDFFNVSRVAQVVAPLFELAERVKDPIWISDVLKLYSKLARYPIEERIQAFPRYTLASLMQYGKNISLSSEDHLIDAELLALVLANVTYYEGDQFTAYQFCEWLIKEEIGDYIVCRYFSYTGLPNVTEMKHLYMCINNIMLDCKDHTFVSENPRFKDMTSALMDQSPLDLRSEVMLWLANAFYYSNSVKDVLDVASMDSSVILIDCLRSRDTILIAALVKSLSHVINTFLEHFKNSANGSINGNIPGIYEFVTQWLDIDSLREPLETIMYKPNLPAFVYNAVEILSTQLTNFLQFYQDYSANEIVKMRRGFGDHME